VHKSVNKTARANKGPKASQKTASVRAGTKTSKLLELLKRPGGITLNKLMKTHCCPANEDFAVDKCFSR